MLEEHGRRHLGSEVVVSYKGTGMRNCRHIHLSNNFLLFLLLFLNLLVGICFPPVISLADQPLDLYPMLALLVCIIDIHSGSRAVANFLVRLATPMLAGWRVYAIENEMP